MLPTQAPFANVVLRWYGLEVIPNVKPAYDLYITHLTLKQNHVVYVIGATIGYWALSSLTALCVLRAAHAGICVLAFLHRAMLVALWRSLFLRFHSRFTSFCELRAARLSQM